jgi:hypothetical protein
MIAGIQTGLENIFDNMHTYVLTEIRKCSFYFAYCNFNDTGVRETFVQSLAACLL